MSLCGAAEKLGTAGPGQAFRASELCYFLLQPQWPQGACAGIPPSTPRLSPKKTRCLRWEKKCTVSRLVANILKCQPFNIKVLRGLYPEILGGDTGPSPPGHLDSGAWAEGFITGSSFPPWVVVRTTRSA